MGLNRSIRSCRGIGHARFWNRSILSFVLAVGILPFTSSRLPAAEEACSGERFTVWCHTYRIIRITKCTLFDRSNGNAVSEWVNADFWCANAHML